MSKNALISESAIPVPTWVTTATTLPVAFAQVREDPLLDLWVVEQLRPGASVALIASGGCTATLLSTAPNLANLHLIDANPAQMALASLKLRLLASLPVHERLSLLGHTSLSAADRQSLLGHHLAALTLPADSLGPIEIVAADGPDHAGRYERVFAALRHALTDAAGDIANLLQLADPTTQSARAAPDTPLGRQLDLALDEVMSLPHLVQLFGAEATKNPVAPFSRHFAGRIRHALATFPAAYNPYLWQMLAGQYPPDTPAPWFTAPIPARMPAITWTVSPVKEALLPQAGAFDFVHLSNVLDWLSPTAATEALDTAAQALRPGGWVLIRQLNSTLDIRQLGHSFDWSVAESDALLARDRSFFYRAIHLGRRR